jgi:restriction system protein
MTLWLVRAGRHGEGEGVALQQNLAVIGWRELPDLSSIVTRDELAALLRNTYPDATAKKLTNWESQIWPFIQVIVPGDLVALPLKTQSGTVAIGRVVGPYKYRADLPADSKHSREVEWLKEIPRTQFDQDLRHSLGAFMTVCRIKRNNAEDRVKGLLSGKPIKQKQVEVATDEDTEEVPFDLEEFARDQIREHIAQKFAGHRLAALVGEILTAQGYQTRVSPEGPDGGVDVIAGRGPLGFDQPRLVVQVKSGDGAIDVKVVRELQGVMKHFGAEHGLVVAWGGYKTGVMKEAARSFFEIRLWDSDDLVRMIQAHYDALPDDIQAELPLKRIWALVLSEE